MIRDLLIITPAAAFREVEEVIGESDFEVHLDRRRGDRRRARASASVGEERRRRHDRRKVDVSEPLRVAGWVLIPAEQRPQW